MLSNMAVESPWRRALMSQTLKLLRPGYWLTPKKFVRKIARGRFAATNSNTYIEQP